MAFSIKNASPLNLYISFVALILAARLFENKIQIVYYLFVTLAWASFYMAARNFFKRNKKTAASKTPSKRTAR